MNYCIRTRTALAQWTWHSFFAVYRFALALLFVACRVLVQLWCSLTSTLPLSLHRRNEDVRRVCIVGGGFCGSSVAQYLEPYSAAGFIDVTLVDASDAFEFTPSVLQLATALWQQHALSRIRVQHRSYLRSCAVVRGTVASCRVESVRTARSYHQREVLEPAGRRHSSPVANSTTEDAADIESARDSDMTRYYVGMVDGDEQGPFDYLVVATGSVYLLPQAPPHSIHTGTGTAAPAAATAPAVSSHGGGDRGRLVVPVTIVHRGAPLLDAVRNAFGYRGDRNHDDSVVDGDDVGAASSYAAHHHVEPRHIVIVGGGITGVELAAEVACNFAAQLVAHDLRITLYHGGPTLLHRLGSAKVSQYVTSFLERRGVEVVTNRRVVFDRDQNPPSTPSMAKSSDKNASAFEPATVRCQLFVALSDSLAASSSPNDKESPSTSSPIEATWAFYCARPVPNTSMLTQSGICESLPSGIPVHPTFQCWDSSSHNGLPYTGLFVCGDAAASANGNELKLAQYAQYHATVVAHNIIALARAPRAAAHAAVLRSYAPARIRLLAISLGKFDGVLLLGPLVIYGVFPALTKQFIEWKTMVYYWSWNFIRRQLFSGCGCGCIRSRAHRCATARQYCHCSNWFHSSKSASDAHVHIV